MTEPNIPVTEDELHAYIDNELPMERRGDVEPGQRVQQRHFADVVSKGGRCVAAVGVVIVGREGAIDGLAHGFSESLARHLLPIRGHGRILAARSERSAELSAA